MIGNDIVDLQLAKCQSNWQRKGWLQKVCTAQEQHYIYASEDPNSTVWKFWTMKEAAYKAHQRRFSLSPKYNPLDFCCSLEGSVHIGDYQYGVTSKLTKNYIYSIALGSEIPYSSEILNIKQSLEQIIAQKLGVNVKTVSIEKDIHRIPKVVINKEIAKITISISNHGQYAAILIC